ncbi:MAG: aminopeptidase P family N-terminal domain-containing protein, partial [Clostridiales bacterium]|nr:aminopeptidase P family N-terminal domain-containing protein [Clostridiales bacterium]
MLDFEKYYNDQIDWTLEHKERLSRFIKAMDCSIPEWETCFIFDRLNQYYFTGTIQDSLLIIKREGKAVLFVRRDYERAKQDSTLEHIYPMGSYRDAAHILGSKCGVICFDAEATSMATLSRLQKYFEISAIRPIDSVILSLRAVKSENELCLMKAAGRAHNHLYQNIVPNLFRENISEAELYADLYAAMVHLGHHGVTRFSMPQSESVCGEIAFSENSLLGTYFDSPGGNARMCSAI